MSKSNLYKRSAKALKSIINDDNDTPAPTSTTETLIHAACSDILSDSTPLVNFDDMDVDIDNMDVDIDMDFNILDSEYSDAFFEDCLDSNDSLDALYDDPNPEQQTVADEVALSIPEELYIFKLIFNLTDNAMQYLLDMLTRHKVADVPSSLYKLNKLHKKPSLEFTKLDNGDVAYLSIKDNLLYLLKQGMLVVEDNVPVTMKVNIDGLPLFKSSQVSLWPILVDFNMLQRPMPVSLFCGIGKPELNKFMDSFVAEVKELRSSGVQFENTIVKVGHVMFVCDAPARAHLMCILGHCAKSGCGYCRLKGVSYKSRVVFPTITGIPRSDQDYAEFKEDNQLSLSLLANIVDLKSDFPIDYQHCICLGVVRRLFYFYFDHVKSFHLRCKLSQANLKSLSDLIEGVRVYVPCEFQRRPRRLDVELSHFKATEFRTFLIYLGPYLFKKFLPTDYYEHFLLLHFSVYVFASAQYTDLHDHAAGCLRRFVQQMPELFGQHSVPYNFHILLHIPEFVKKYGPLDSFSTFEFENFLGMLKRRIRQTNFIFQQSVNQLIALRFLCLSQPPADRSLSFTSKTPNNCALIGQAYVLVDTCSADQHIGGFELQFVKDLYTYPYSSSTLRIGYYRVSRKRVAGLPTGKAIALPVDQEYLVFPYCN